MKTSMKNSKGHNRNIGAGNKIASMKNSKGYNKDKSVGKKIASHKPSVLDSNDNDGAKWYESEVPEDPEDFDQPSGDLVLKLKNEAKEEMENSCAKHRDKMSSTSDYNWMRTIMSKGTTSDKIASFTVSIQDSPLYSLSLLQNLVNMIKMGKRKDCFTVIDTLTELFLEDLIPKNWVKLRLFAHRPLTLLDSFSRGKPSLRRKILLTWYFEEELKKVFGEFVAVICEVAAKDAMEKNRMQAISALYKLLSNTAEKEDIILSNLVNKLGDPNLKVASKATYCLKQVLYEHPNMKGVIKDEIEKLLFRQNISSKAQFYGLCFLNQYYLTEDDEDLAKDLIKLYFSFFKMCIKKGEIDSRMMSALLTGVKRAYPFAKVKMEDKSLTENIQTVHKIVHLGSFNISVHALSLLLQVMDCSSDVISDRFYTALYKKILDPQLASSNLQAMFISMCFKALKSDTDDSRKKAFVKRFLQICLYLPVPLACGVLYMISEILRHCQDKKALEFHGTSDSSKVKEEKIVDVLDDDEYEHYTDIKLEDDEIKIKEEKDEEIETEIADVKIEKDLSGNISSWVYRPGINSNENNVVRKSNAGYDPLQRNPRFAVSSDCTFSELIRLSQHFHPTVALFAKQLSMGENIVYTGDPLQDFTLLRFLNRFAFKNPKKADKGKDDEKTVEGAFTRKNNYAPQGLKSLPVTSMSYLNEREEKIPVDEVFLYKYIHQRRDAKMKLKKEEKEESDNESVDSDEFEEVMQKYIGGKKGKKADEDDDKEDEDLDFAKEVDFDEDEDYDGESKPVKVTKKKVKTKKRKAVEVESDSGSDESDVESDDDDLAKVFASAEEFSEMLQDTGASQLDQTGASALSNKDNAGIKQLRWEEARNKWIKGVDKYSKKGHGSFRGKHKPQGKRPKLKKR